MKFVEFKDTTGAMVLVNATGVLYLRPAEGGCTDMYLVGRSDPLRLNARILDVAEVLEGAMPEPPEPLAALIS